MKRDCRFLLALALGLTLAAPAHADFKQNDFTDPGRPPRDSDSDRAIMERHGYNPRTNRFEFHDKIVRIYTPPNYTRLIIIQDQKIIEVYLRGNPRFGTCPPGTALNMTGCPPANYVRPYQIGNELPPNIIVQSLPNDLLGRLRPPAGYTYARVDNDIVLLNQGTRRVADAVVLAP